MRLGKKPKSLIHKVCYAFEIPKKTKLLFLLSICNHVTSFYFSLRFLFFFFFLFLSFLQSSPVKKIIVHAPDENDGCSFYRSYGPLFKLPKLLPDLLVERMPHMVSWGSLMGGDILFLQRPYHNKHVVFAEIAAKQMALWVDYDDLLTELPFCNPAYEQYCSPSVRSNIIKLLKMANVVSASTLALAQELQELAGLDVIPNVIHNAYNDYVLPTTPNDKNATQTVLWRGGPSHVGDLAEVAEGFKSVIKDNPTVDFVFIGFVPWMLDVEAQNLKVYESVDIFDFQARLNALAPLITVVPLQNSKFNRCKSNIAWIESTMAGGAVLAPDLPEWRQPGVTRYTSPEDFKRALQTMLNKESVADRVAKSYSAVTSKFLLSKTNLIRAELVKALT